MLKLGQIICALLLLQVNLASAKHFNVEILYESPIVNFWSSDRAKQSAIQNGDFIPENCKLSGIAVNKDKDDVYVSIPRIKSAEGVPYVLGRLHSKYFSPFPNTKINQVGDCTVPQNPLAIEIDKANSMLYVADTGRVDIGNSNSTGSVCPPKLWIYSLKKSKVVWNYTFPDTIVPRDKVILTNLVLDFLIPRPDADVKIPRFAYITDDGNSQIITVDLLRSVSFVSRHPSMIPNHRATTSINGEEFKIDYGLNGIAMSPDFDFVYYSTTDNLTLYQIPTWVLRKPGADFGNNVRTVGDKVSYTDGIVHGKVSLYYGALSLDAVYRWDVSKDMKSQNKGEGQVTMATQSQILQSWEGIQWPDSLALDHEGYLWFTSSRNQLFYSGNMDFTGNSGSNFRVYRIKVNDESYLDY